MVADFKCRNNDKMIKEFASRGFLRDLVLDNIIDVKDILAMRQRLGIDCNPNTAMAISIDNYHIKMYKESEFQKHELRSKVLHTLEKACAASDALAVSMEEELFALAFEASGDLDIGV